MSWANEDEPPSSQFGIQMHNQEPNGALNPFEFNTFMKIATLMNGGIIRHYNTAFHDYFLPATIVGSFVVHPIPSIAITFLLLLALGWRCFKWCRKPAEEVPFPPIEKDETACCPDPESLLHNVSTAITHAADKENIRVLKTK